MTMQSYLHERIVDVATTHRSDLGLHKSSPATDVRLLYTYWALNTCLSRFYCALTAHLLCFMGLFPLILRPQCAATETMMSKALFRRLQ